MKNYFYLCVFVLLLCFFTDCEKNKLGDETEIKNNDPYPTTFERLPDSKLSLMRNSFANKYRYMWTSLNKFGFCAGEGLINAASPPRSEVLTEREAIEVVKNFVSQNTDYTGVVNPDDMTFVMKNFTEYYDGGTGWHFRTSNQTVNAIEVLNTMVVFHSHNRELVGCDGHWYLGVVIPDKFNISTEEAKFLLLGYVVSHYTFGDVEYKVEISAKDLDNSVTEIKIMPIITEEKIELRVVWQINIPAPVYYMIYVDVMTGEIIADEPTIIS